MGWRPRGRKVDFEGGPAQMGLKGSMWMSGSDWPLGGAGPGQES